MVKILKKRKNWLSFKCLIKLKSQHKDLFIVDKKVYWFNIRKFIASKYSIFLILPIIVLLFVICFLNISFMPVLFYYHVEKVDDIVKIFDARIQNFATIISIAFVIIGLIINNLSLKQREAYKLLFEITYLYPLLYFSFSLLVVMILFSHLRDTVSIDTLIRALSLSYWLIITALGLIVWQFFNLTVVTDSVKITGFIIDQLYHEVKEICIKDLLSRYSRIAYIEELNEIGAEMLTPEKDIKKYNCLFELSEESCVIDINVFGIKKYIKELIKSAKIYYEPISIYDYSESSKQLFFATVSVDHFKENVRSFFELGPLPKNEKSMEKVFRDLNDKREQAITNNDHELNKLILDTIEKFNFIFNEIREGNDE